MKRASVIFNGNNSDSEGHLGARTLDFQKKTGNSAGLLLKFGWVDVDELRLIHLDFREIPIAAM